MAPDPLALESIKRAPRVLDPQRADDHPSLRAWLALQHALALSPKAAVGALLQHGLDPVRALRAARSGAHVGDLDRSLGALTRAGARLVPYGSDAYPDRLDRLVDPPPVLTVCGDLEVLGRPGIAFVGSRAASAVGRASARRLAGELAAAGVVIVSGLARGIDAAAHTAALEAGGATVAVQACGCDRIYPASHRGLAREIVASGAVITELPPGTPPRAPHFPLRNRLISALSLAVVVIEARERSGTLITARHALDQGVEVFVVPGTIEGPLHRGSNALLRDGAWPLLEAGDVFDRLGLGAPAPAAAPARPDGNEPLIERLERTPATADELSRALGIPAATLALDLLALELAGRIVQDRDGRFRVVG